MLNAIISGIVDRDSDPGEPLTPEDFEYAQSAEFLNEIANEEDHDEDGSSSLFEGDIEMSDAEQRQALMERGIPGLREVSIMKVHQQAFFKNQDETGCQDPKVAKECWWEGEGSLQDTISIVQGEARSHS